MARPTKNNPTGAQRKPKCDDPEIVRKLREAFSLDCPVEEACYYANIGKQTYYDLIKYKPELADEFERLKQQPTFRARKCVVKAAENESDVAMKYLERKRKAEFSPRAEIETNITATFSLVTLSVQAKQTEQEVIEAPKKENPFIEAEITE